MTKRREATNSLNLITITPSVDLEAKRRLDAVIQEARMRREYLEGEAKTLSEEEVTLRGEGDTLKQKMVC